MKLQKIKPNRPIFEPENETKEDPATIAANSHLSDPIGLASPERYNRNTTRHATKDAITFR